MSILNSRLVHSHDTEENWNQCLDFIPKAGELIVYDVDTTHPHERFKIGDGETSVVNLPFSIDSAIISFFNITDNILNIDGGRITKY